MTINELIEVLNKLKEEHGNIEIVYRCCSDWSKLRAEEITTTHAIHLIGKDEVMEDYEYYTKRFEPHQLERRKYVAFPGN